MACPVTVYRPTASNDARRIVFYLHGGGLVYGERDDLPSPYIRAITDAGSTLVCADYPLAPETALPDIVDALYETWRTEVAGPIERGECIDYLLFGRSAGAYLALLLAREIRLRDQNLPQPAGIMSFYGYYNLGEPWVSEPASAYLALPEVSLGEVERIVERGGAQPRGQRRSGTHCTSMRASMKGRGSTSWGSTKPLTNALSRPGPSPPMTSRRFRRSSSQRAPAMRTSPIACPSSFCARRRTRA